MTVLKVSVGLMIAGLHGLHKVVDGFQYLTAGRDWPLLRDTVQLGFPLPVVFASAAAVIQLAGGLLIAAGAFTRPAALLVLITMLTAVVFNVQTGGPDAQLASLYALAMSTVALGTPRTLFSSTQASLKPLS
jgi:putative oxidoreductase